MAASSTINQRIVLSGAEEVRRHLEEIGKAGERSGNQTRQALLAASSGANSFTGGARAASASSGQMRFALQNLSFQVNDVVTSLASGGDAMRVFAQQGGQVFQVFQQGGGAGAVLGAAATAIRGMITPMTVAAAAAVGLAAGLAVVISRAISSQTSAREFDIILKGMGKSSIAAGAELEDAARRLRDVGLNAAEARTALSQAIREGLDPKQAERIVRIGQDLNAVLGQGSLEKFTQAAAKGGEPLREFAERLGIVPKAAKDSAAALRDAGGAAAESARSVAAAFSSRNQAIANEQRNAITQIEDLTRKRGTAEEEIEYNSKQRILKINQDSVVAINALLAQRNIENAKRLAEYNKLIEDEAQKAANTGRALIDQIEQRVKGLANEALGPGQRAMRDLGVAWNDLLDTLSKNEVVLALIRDFTTLIKVITEAIQQISLARQLSGAAPLDLTSPTATAAFSGNFASGGLVRGPGSGMSDSIVARLSNGEFVNTAAAVQRFGVGFFESLNRMAMPVMPRFTLPRGFAHGGLVPAGGGGAPVNINIGGGTFALMGDRQVVSALSRAARRRTMLSAGRKPSAA